MVDIKAIEKEILEDRVIFLTGEFDEENCDSVMKQLLYLESKGKKDITLYIDSYGGYVTDFFKVHDIIKSLRSKVHTVVTGKAMSAGSYLLVSGNKRFAYKHSSIMIHELSSNPGYSKVSAQTMSVDYNKKVQAQLDAIIIDNTKITSKDLETWNFKDVYLTADEALKLGVIDGIF